LISRNVRMTDHPFSINRHVLISCLVLSFVVLSHLPVEAQIVRPRQPVRQLNTSQPSVPLVPAIPAQNAVREILATGRGSDQITALEAALHAAAIQVNGTMTSRVEAERNGETFVRRYVFSGAFVESYKVEGVETTSEGIDIHILARVRPMDSVTIFRRNIIAEGGNWANYFAERDTIEYQLDAGIGVLQTLIKVHLMNCISTSITPKNNHFQGIETLEFRTTVDYDKYNDFVIKFTDQLRHMGINPAGSRPITLEQQEVELRKRLNRRRDRATVMHTTDRGLWLTERTGDNGVLYIARTPVFAPQVHRQSVNFVRYDFSLPHKVFYAIDDSFSELLEKKSRVLEFRDEFDKIVDEYPYRMFVPFHHKNEGRPIFLFPLLAVSEERVWEDPHDGFFPGVPVFIEEIKWNKRFDRQVHGHGHTFRFE